MGALYNDSWVLREYVSGLQNHIDRMHINKVFKTLLERYHSYAGSSCAVTENVNLETDWHHTEREGINSLGGFISHGKSGNLWHQANAPRRMLALIGTDWLLRNTE